MARRALLTESEREALQNPDEKENPYVAVSRVRKKIDEELSEDVRVLRENHDQLFAELHDVVCSAGTLSFTPLGSKNISYGPSSREDAAFVLRVGTGDGTVEIHLDDDEMYELWTEVQHTPWPDRSQEQEEAGELRQELVDRAMGADEETLRDALDAMDPHWEER